MENRNTVLGINKKALTICHKIMLIAFLHSSLVAPSQDLFINYINCKKSSFSSSSAAYEGSGSLHSAEDEALSSRSEWMPEKDSESTIVPSETQGIHKRGTMSYTLDADLSQGVIGVSTSKPLDDAKDNLFKFKIDNQLVAENTKVFLTYDLYGIQDCNGVSRSINDRPSTGGYVIKIQNGWTSQKEELNINWLSQGENKILFSVPKEANFQYQIKNVKLEFNVSKDNAFNSALVVNSTDVTYAKEDKIYIKGFLRDYTTDVKILAEQTPLQFTDGEFEGFLTLNEEVKNRKFVIIYAFDKNGLLGQQMISLDHLVQADNLYAIEKSYEAVSKFVNAKTNTIIETEGALLKVSDSSMLESKEIRISKLRKVDIAPMSSGMINVTKGGLAYRFLPDGTKFNNPVSIELEYDQHLIPKGYTPNDIKTFYFSTTSKSWVAVHRDSLNEHKKTIVSSTNHFTDYINGIIQTPESPETAGFTPTAMNDIQAADPSSEMTIISPPSVSQTGDANISYPIKIPGGRNGMLPQVALNYNDKGDSGWLGLGWNVSAPAISIDSRWGVPSFDMTHESEMYTLNGEQLMYPKQSGFDWMPNRHNDFNTNGDYNTNPRERSSGAQFTLRKQGSFVKIERLGDDPTNYYWKVVGTDGSINWYGGKTSQDITDGNSVIKNDQGNIIHWALFMSEDVHGNNIKYFYNKTIVTGQSGMYLNLNEGETFYLKEIKYTGHNNGEGKYRVEFNLQEEIRQDPTFNAKLGKKQVDPYLLNEIVIYNETTIIRKYKMTYDSGRFNKTLLKFIRELDKNDLEFYKHEFKYYDDVALNNNNLFQATERVILPNIDPSFTLGFGSLLNPSHISTNENVETSFSVRPSVGIEIRLGKSSHKPENTFTIGMPFGWSYSKGKGKISLTDIDGDGLDDVVYRDSDGLKYFSNSYRSTSNELSPFTTKQHYNGFLGEAISINGISDFYKSSGKTKTMFLESWDFMFRKYYFGTKRTKSESDTPIYFTDGNSDGLMDVVKNGVVYFNYLDATTQEPTFVTSSDLTPNMLITGELPLSPIEEPDPEDELAMDYDVVKVWIAPKAGKIKIEDNISIIDITPESRAVYSIESNYRGANCRIYLKELTSNNPSAIVNLQTVDVGSPLNCYQMNGSNELEVSRGQKFYFRLHKNVNGINDEIQSNPKITYIQNQNPSQSLTNLYDENQNNMNVFDYAESFLLTDENIISIKGDGTVNIGWDNINVFQQSDNILFTVEKTTATGVSSILFQKNCSANQTTLVSVNSNEVPTNIASLPVNAGDEIVFKIHSKSNVKWNAINWIPTLSYTPTVVNTEEGIMAFTKKPIPHMTIFKCELYGTKITQASFGLCDGATSNNYMIKPNIGLVNWTPLPSDNCIFNLVVKKAGVLVDKREVKIVGGVITVANPNPITIYQGSLNNFTVQDEISVDFYVDGSLAEYETFQRYWSHLEFGIPYLIGVNNVFIAYNNLNPYCTGTFNSLNTYNVYTNYLHQFNNLNKNWGQFFYNANLDDDTSILSDTYGKLLNETIINNPIGNVNNPIENSGCDPNLPFEIYEDCVNDYLEGLMPAYANEDDVENAIGNLQGDDIGEINDPAIFAFLPAIPNRKEFSSGDYIDQWIGFFDSQFAAQYSFKTGDFEDSGFNQVFDDEDSDLLDQPVDIFTGMYAINKKHKSSSRSYTGGFGSFHLSKSESAYSNSLTEFMDLNGDGYPDILNTAQFQLSTMTGGHKEPETNLLFGAVDSYFNKNLAFTASKNHAIAGRAIKGAKDKEGNRTNIGNASATMGVSATANLSGENKSDEFWLDLNGDGILEKIYKDVDEFKYKLISVQENASTLSYDAEKMYDLEPRNSYAALFEASISVGDGFDISNVTEDTGQGSTFTGSLSAGYGGNRSNTDVTFTDLNGDGLVDMIKPGVVKFNTGNGFSNTAQILSMNTSGSPGSDPNVSLWKDSRNRSVSLAGTLSYFYGYPICCPFPIVGFVPIIHIKAGVTIGGSASLTISESVKDFRDLDGDGFADYLEYNAGNYHFGVAYSAIRRTNKLETVINPLGGKFTIDYNPIKKTFDNPHSKWVMSSITINDGYDKTNDGEDIYSSAFEYEGAKYDRRERAFYGFNVVKSIDYIFQPSGNQYVKYRTKESKYHNDSYFLNGLMYETGIYNNEDKAFSKSYNYYELKELSTASNNELIPNSSLPFTFDVGGTEGRRSAAVLLTRTVSELYELSSSPQLTSETVLKYDAKGRVIEYINNGNVASSADNYMSLISYHDFGNDIINVPSQIEVLVNGVVKRKRTTLVDDTSTGRITGIRHYLSGSVFSETTMKYNNYGNLTKITSPGYGTSTMSYDYSYDTDFKYVTSITDAYGYTSTALYDANFDALLETKDLAGNKMTYAYDTFGRTTHILAPKEIEAGEDYTIKFEYYPHLSLLPSSSQINSVNFVPVAVTKHYDPQHPGNDIETYTFIDGLARPIQVKKDIYIDKNNNPYSPSFAEALSISGKTKFDQFGRAIEQFHPYYELKSATNNFKMNGYSSSYSSLMEYDELDRQTKSIDPEGNISTVQYTLGQDVSGTMAIKMKSTVEQNTNQNIVTESYKDVSGRVIATMNDGPGGALWTKFTYNAIGELLSYTDAESISTSYEYDNFGRKTSVNHPDNGITRFTYDIASNLTQLQTANLANQGQVVSYQYDRKRLTNINYPNNPDGSPNISNVTYHYGSSGNETGRLVYQSDASGEQTFTYGNMGEMILNKRTVVGPTPNMPVRMFETAYTYDSWNRLQEMTYPDGERVVFNYDLGGNLTQMRGNVNGSDYEYIERIDYDYFEQRTYLRYGNQTETFYTYSPALRRLGNLKVKTSDGQDLFNNEYGYDKVGNVLGIQNYASITNNGMGGSYYHNFEYDKLNRLTLASGLFEGDQTQAELGNDYQSDYNLAMEYNNSHGIFHKEQNHTKNGMPVDLNTYSNNYEYVQGTHKLSKMTDGFTGMVEYFLYDANGNMIGNANDQKDRTMMWDESNRLRVAVDFIAHSMQHYIYDASGERVLKANSDFEYFYENGTLINPSGVTMNSYISYPSAFLVIDENGIYSKHYYAGSQRIVSRIGDENPGFFDQSAMRTTESKEGSLDYKKLQAAQTADLQQYLDKEKMGKVTFKEFKAFTYEEIESEFKKDNEEDQEGVEKATTPAPQAMMNAPLYFYHPDHLGTSTFLTDSNGNAYQFFLNLPFGETMAEQKGAEFYQSPYKFNGKELDEETGLYYYGARYYDPRASIWLSVDPLAEMFPSSSPYEYCFSNPVNLTDPTGMSPEDGGSSTDGEDFYRDEVTNDVVWIEGSDPVEGYEHLGYNFTIFDSYNNKVAEGDGVTKTSWSLLGGYLNHLNEVVLSPAAKMSYYIDFNVSAAVVAGFGIGFSYVSDSYGKKAIAFSFDVKQGVGVGVGFGGGKIKSIDENLRFKVDDHEGGSVSQDGNIGPVGVSRGFDVKSGTSYENTFSPEAANSRFIYGGGFIDGSDIRLSPKLRPKLSFEATQSYRTTYNLLTW